MPETWRKSTRCGASNTCVEVAAWRTACSNEANCVEVGDAGTAVAVRDQEGTVLPMTRSAFADLLAAIKEDR